LAREWVGPTRDPNNARSHRLEINSMVIDGRLEVGWRYGSAHRRETVERLVRLHLDALREILECVLQDEPELAASDFPLAGLDQQQLDRLMNRLRAADRRSQ
jgi:non-ribosomal peptide synthase protein (TIGR01720 family)